MAKKDLYEGLGVHGMMRIELPKQISLMSEGTLILGPI